MSAKVLTLFSTKGGVGKTLIATNLALTLQRAQHQRTALLDLSSNPIDSALLLGSSGVTHVEEPLTLESFDPTLERLRQGAKFVLIDGGSVVHSLAVRAFERSNLILLVMTPDEVAVKHTEQTLERLAQLKFPMRMVMVIVNRAGSRGSLAARDIERRVQAPVIAELPSDGRLATLSVNRKTSLTLLQPESRLAQALQEVAELLVNKPELFVEQFAIDAAALAIPRADRQPLPATASGGISSRKVDPIAQAKHRIQDKLIERMDLKRVDLGALNDPEQAKQLRARVEQVALDVITEERGFIANDIDRRQLVKEIVDDAIGLGPLESLIADDTITDILVNGKDQIYIERHGKLELTDKRFLSNDQVLAVIERIVARLGRRIDESTPMVDARLPDGSRVNAIIPPLSLTGPTLSIRKFSRTRYTQEDLIAFNSLTPSMAEFIRACIIARKNLIVSGGTGSGKTTMLNIISMYIPEGERILTIEDAAELRLSQTHWVSLEARPPNVEGKGQVAIRDLFRNALRMRPDRIIIGECRGAETLDMLQAMNTGHDGSITTVHANSPKDVIGRLDSMVLMSNIELPVRAIREMVASAIHLIIHTARLSDGARKVTVISELVGLKDEGDVHLEDIFVFQQTGVASDGSVQGHFTATGYRPSFLRELASKGLELSPTLFDASRVYVQ